MSKAKNILFIVCDQLRADYLSCAGHPRLETPNIDALAKRGVYFPQSFCQAPICGGSRMSFYTGRYNFTHGATWNYIPLNVSEKTIGDYLRPLGHRVALVGIPARPCAEQATVCVVRWPGGAPLSFRGPGALLLDLLPR